MLSRKLLLFSISMQKFLTMITTISATEPESKLMNNSSIAVGELHDGLLSMNTIDFKLKIPKECQETDICQHVLNYPQEYVSKIIAYLQSQGMNLTYDKKWWEDDEKDLCRSVPEVIFPQAVRDSNNKWHLALNSPEVPQKIIGRKCETTSSDCSNLISFDNDYNGCCDQRYMPRKIIALDLSIKNVMTISTPVASCCICVAKKVKDYKGD